MFSAESFCEDYQIPWFPPGTKNVGRGYIGICCPFCDDTSSHGGFNISKSFYNCHRCGGHWILKIIAALTKTNIHNAKKIFEKYSSDESIAEKFKPNKYVSEVTFPPDTGPLNEKAKQYLINRNFDPNKLVSEWGLLSTGHAGEYKFSILAPIYLHGLLISYQCRDITGKNPTPYKGCSIDESVYNHKHSLYGIDKAMPQKKCVVVEGITDTWRLGPGAVSTFSMNFTIPQIRLLVQSFDYSFILYDPEPQAQAQAEKLFHYITGCGKEAEILNLPDWIKDPGDLSDNSAKEIMKELGL